MDRLLSRSQFLLAPYSPLRAAQGSFASRMSHSCTPNCAAVVVSVDGRLTIAIYTKRDIAPGALLAVSAAASRPTCASWRDSADDPRHVRFPRQARS